MKRYMMIAAALLAALFSSTANAQDTGLPKYEFRLGWSGYPVMDYENFTVGTTNDYYGTPIKDMFTDFAGDTYMTGNIMAAMDFHL